MPTKIINTCLEFGMLLLKYFGPFSLCSAWIFTQYNGNSLEWKPYLNIFYFRFFRIFESLVLVVLMQQRVFLVMVNVFSFDPPLHQMIWKLLAVIFGKYFVIFLDKCSKVLLNSTTAKKSVSTFSFLYRVSKNMQNLKKYWDILLCISRTP